MEDIKRIFDNTDKKLRCVIERNYGKLPYSTTDGVYDNKYESDKTWWTNGFYPALCLVMYNITGFEGYLTAARRGEELLNEAFKNRDGLHHDVGFMWYLSSGADYILTGRKEARDTTLFAADMLAGRFNIKGGFIRAWNDEGSEKRDTWTIIDCLMNIPLLYFASEEIGDERYALMAKSHADITMRDHVREDGSTNHICVHDNPDRSFSKALRGQGMSEKSCWSRGNAWAVYGFMQSYLHTKDEKYLKTAIKCADYFEKQIEKTGYVAKCDFEQDENCKLIDTSAGLIASCGLVEITNVTGIEKYKETAVKIIKATEKYCDWDEKRDGIVMQGCEAYNEEGVQKHLVYADYYLAECLGLLMGKKIGL